MDTSEEPKENEQSETPAEAAASRSSDEPTEEERKMLEELEGGGEESSVGSSAGEPTEEELAMLRELEGESSTSESEADPVVAQKVGLPQLEEAERDFAADNGNLDMILDIPIDVHVEIGHTRTSIKDILNLGTGSIIELDRLAGGPADIMVNGKLVGQGDVVVVNENFGIRITKLVGPKERIASL